MLYSLENAKHSEIMLENLENCEQNQENVSYISFTIYCILHSQCITHGRSAEGAKAGAESANA